MKALIIYKSVTKNKNIEKVAKAMAEVMDAKLVQPEDVDIASLADFDLIGFGSGLFARHHHETILSLIDRIPANNKNAFVFSTGEFNGHWWSGHKGTYLADTLKMKSWNVKGTFWCGGETPGMLFGTRFRGRPDAKDLENARAFAKSLMN